MRMTVNTVITKIKYLITIAVFAIAAAGITGCSGSSNSSEMYSVSGKLTGLKTGESLVLKNHLGEELTLNANGEFRFEGKLTNNSSYNHLIERQPSCQTCTVENGSGVVTGSNVTNLNIVCGAAQYYIGGKAYGLAPGQNFTIELNGNQSLIVNENGPFSFYAFFNDKTAYSLAITEQPQNQTCTCSNATGNINADNVTYPVVICKYNPSRFAYSADAGNNSISINRVNGLTGQLTQNGSAAAGNYPVSVAVESSGRFLYAANEHDGTVSAYGINPSTGALAPVSGSPFTAGSSPYCVASDPYSRYLYVANTVSNNISGYSITPSTGALTELPGSPFAAGTNPNSVTIDPTGRFVYAANYGGNTISAYVISQGGMPSGMLVPVSGSPYPANGPQSIAIDPSGRLAFVANQNNNTIGVYSINQTTGALSPVAGSPFTAGNKPSAVAVHPSADYVYVANSDANNVQGFSFNASSGALTSVPGGPFATANHPVSIAIDDTGKFLHAANAGASSISTFSINPITGALVPVTGSHFPVGPSPLCVATVLAGDFTTYVLGSDTYQIYAYGLNLRNGVIEQGAKVYNYEVSGAPESLSIDPSGSFIYASTAIRSISLNGNYVFAYYINPLTGMLSQVPGSPFAADVLGVMAMHPLAAYVYIPGVWGFSAYSVEGSTGALKKLLTGTFPPAGDVEDFVMDPLGRFGFLSYNENAIYAFSIDSKSGEWLSNVPGSPYGDFQTPEAMTIDPSGRFFYFINTGENKLYVYTINSTTGELEQASASPYSFGSKISDIAIDPSGSYLYLAGYGSPGTITPYSINQTIGEITLAESSPVHPGHNAFSMNFDPTGKFLYVLNNGNNPGSSTITISVYIINPASGALREVYGSPFSTHITSGTISGMNYTVKQ